MKVILISGKAGSGKDTFAKMLKEQLEIESQKVLIAHYADLVKYICTKYFDWDGNKDEKGRTLLQYIGTDVIRKKNPDFWVGFVQTILTYFNENWDYAIIPDCRFPNEVDVMKSNPLFDVTHIKIVRPEYQSGLTEEQMNHASETALDDIIADYYIVNNSSLEKLKITTSTYVKEIMHEK